jgi:hypothetical protein
MISGLRDEICTRNLPNTKQEWRGIVRTVMNLLVLEKAANLLLNKRLLIS